MIDPGTKLGPYTIVRPLGSGGMGVVYRARDSRLGRDVAIKLLPDHLSADAVALGRFQREVRALAALSHPNIVTIFDFGTEGSVRFAVTELLEGETLRARIARAPVSEVEALAIGAAVAEGLAAAHAKGIIHRDLKPENIFLLSAGGTKILDFGLARWEEPEASSDLPIPDPDPSDDTSVDTAGGLTSPFQVSAIGLTNTFHSPAADLPLTSLMRTEPGSVVGTYHYMSPEQVRGHPLDARTDLFSFGVVLYEMVTRAPAFPGSTVEEITTAILCHFPSGLNRGEDLPCPGLIGVIRRCLEKNRESRLATAQELVAALKEASLTSLSSLSGHATRSDRSAVAGMSSVRDHPALDSIAVLPLDNAGRDPEMDYLGEGITESIINTLAQLPRLRVMAQSVVLRYKDREINPQDAGRELGVGAVLMGRVSQRGEQLIVGVELVKVADGSQLWGERFRRDPSDLMAVQEEIAREISVKLQLKLSGEDERRLGRRYTENAEAYRAYLRGRYFCNMRTAEGFKKAIAELNRAIDLDPDYSLAYAGLADIYTLAEPYQAIPGTISLPKSRALALRALEIDSDLAEAYPPLSCARFWIDRDPLLAEAELHRAIELSPAYATAYQWYSVLLIGLGRHEQAIVEAKRAVELDPLSRSINWMLGIAYYHARMFDLSVEQYQKTLEIDENFSPPRDWLGLAYVALSRPDQAITELTRACELSGRHPSSLSMLGVAYAAAGRRDEAHAVLTELNEMSGRRYVSALSRAHVYAGLDDKDEAIVWLRKACDEYNVLTVWTFSDPLYDRLRSDPRMRELSDRLHVR